MSTLLSEEDLNDFISPELACTKPTEVKKSKIKKSNVNALGEYEVGFEGDYDVEEVEKVTITLSDCLACSGCITSSEEIMLQRQSHGVFLEAMKKRGDGDKLAVVISPQCRVSMAMYYGMDVSEFDLCLSNLFHSYFNALFVVGIQKGRNISIKQNIDKITQWKLNTTENNTQPSLSADCPGFVIYTEKTKPELVPLLVNVKSPQQITGALLNETFDKYHRDNNTQTLYTLSIMACFDKKLEASRPDSEGEINCVITPKEFVAMLRELKLNFMEYTTNDTRLLQQLSPHGWDPAIHWANNAGSSSGGLAFQYILQLQKQHPGAQILTIPGKNTNIVEYRLISIQNTTIASSCELSGFRNIQNMVRHLNNSASKTGHFPQRKLQVLRKRRVIDTSFNDTKVTVVACPYQTDFIEVNASPGGCINGSGLLNSEPSTIKKRAYTQRTLQLYKEAFTIIDPLEQFSSKQETTHQYEYVFHPMEQKPKDIVSVGNTW